MIQGMFEETLRRDLEKKRLWAVLDGGAERPLDLFLDLIRRYGPDTSPIQDIIHVVAFLLKAASGFLVVERMEAEIGWLNGLSEFCGSMPPA